MKLIHKVREGCIMSPGLNYLATGGWCLMVPLWTKFQTRYNLGWMEEQTGDWRLYFLLRYRNCKLRLIFDWSPPCHTQ